VLFFDKDGSIVKEVPSILYEIPAWGGVSSHPINKINTGAMLAISLVFILDIIFFLFFNFP
jgi:hypothetical protein